MNFIKMIKTKLKEFLRISHRRYYDHVISLGYNCEVSFQFFLKYHFVESSLFAWANTTDCNRLTNVLKNLDKLASRGFAKKSPMYVDIATGILFHGKENSGTEKEILNELSERIVYLRDKFKTTASDGKKNLYIFKYPSSDFSGIKAQEDIINLHKTLSYLVKNDFDLLVISEKKNEIKLDSIDNIFIRYVDFFTPENRVTSKPYDKASFNKIFKLFRPSFKLKKKKHYKFEYMRND